MSDRQRSQPKNTTSRQMENKQIVPPCSLDSDSFYNLKMAFVLMNQGEGETVNQYDFMMKYCIKVG